MSRTSLAARRPEITMSDPIGVSVEFAAPFSLENVTKVIECVRAAVLENWEKHADQYSNPTPNLAELELPAVALRIVEEIVSGKDKYQSGSCASGTEHFSYSPLSFWDPYLTFWKASDGTMRVRFTILSSRPPYERQGDRERERIQKAWEEECQGGGKPWHEIMRNIGPLDGELDEEAVDAWSDKYNSLGELPSVWPENRQCFLNVIEHWKKALPVREVHFDWLFRDAPDKT